MKSKTKLFTIFVAITSIASVYYFSNQGKKKFSSNCTILPSDIWCPTQALASSRSDKVGTVERVEGLKLTIPSALASNSVDLLSTTIKLEIPKFERSSGTSNELRIGLKSSGERKIIIHDSTSDIKKITGTKYIRD